MVHGKPIREKESDCQNVWKEIDYMQDKKTEND
jgi:hypothetical protein